MIKPTAFIRHFNHQIDICYELNNRMTIVSKYGLERVLGNKYTDIDDTDPYPTDNLWGVTDDYTPSFKPRNQFGNLLGVGFDIKLNNGAYLFLRHSNLIILIKTFQPILRVLKQLLNLKLISDEKNKFILLLFLFFFFPTVILSQVKSNLWYDGNV